MSAISKKENQRTNFVCGLFSKKEASEMIARGVEHVHSSTLGYRDAYARVTEEYLSDPKLIYYPWEKQTNPSMFKIRSSNERYDKVKELLNVLNIESDRKLKEKVSCIFEELITNSIFHGIRKEDGSRKYNRKEKVQLEDNESVLVKFSKGNTGVYLSVEDSGGYLKLEDIKKSFDRCYQKISIKYQQKSLGLVSVYTWFLSWQHIFELTFGLERKQFFRCGYQIGELVIPIYFPLITLGGVNSGCRRKTKN